jgi:RNA polymerase sigma-70 factor (ECF subfamily)
MASSPWDPPRPWSSPERYADLVEPLVKPMVAAARRILRSDDLAVDAVQEALLSLWLQAELPPNPRAWLLRTVMFRSLHLARTRARRRKHESRACQSRPEASDRDDPAAKLEREDLLRAVCGAFIKIAPEQREVLVLRAIEEKDYESIASALRIPVGTVRSRLNRSRQALRALFGQPLPEEEPGFMGQAGERGDAGTRRSHEPSL